MPLPTLTLPAGTPPLRRDPHALTDTPLHAEVPWHRGSPRVRRLFTEPEGLFLESAWGPLTTPQAAALRTFFADDAAAWSREFQLPVQAFGDGIATYSATLLEVAFTADKGGRQRVAIRALLRANERSPAVMPGASGDHDTAGGGPAPPYGELDPPPDGGGYTGSVWDTGAPLTVLGGAPYTVFDGGRSIEIEAGSAFQRVETVSTPTKTTGVRYFELSWIEALDQAGFATGDICAAGGTIDFLSEPVGTLVNVQRNFNTGVWTIWLRKWTAGPTFEEAFIGIDSIGFGQRVGFEVDLDSGETRKIYVDGTEIAPGPLSGADLTNWNNLSTWAGGQIAAPQFQQRSNFGFFQIYLHTSTDASSDPPGPVLHLPSGVAAWDAS